MNRQRGFGTVTDIVILGLVVAAFSAFAYAAWHSFTESYRDEGRAEVREKYSVIGECDKRKIAPAACVDHWLAADRDRATATANLAGCQSAAAAQSEAITAAESAARDAKAATSRILADLAKRSDATLAEIARLRTIAATPAASRKEACDEADSVLRALADRRMRFAPGAAAAGGGSDGGGTGAGSSAVRIRQ